MALVPPPGGMNELLRWVAKDGLASGTGAVTGGMIAGAPWALGTLKREGAMPSYPLLDAITGVLELPRQTVRGLIGVTGWTPPDTMADWAEMLTGDRNDILGKTIGFGANTLLDPLTYLGGMGMGIGRDIGKSVGMGLSRRAIQNEAARSVPNSARSQALLDALGVGKYADKIDDFVFDLTSWL